MTKVTMLGKIERRAFIKFLTKQGKCRKNIHEEMATVYQYFANPLSTVQKWSNGFKSTDRVLNTGLTRAV